jgi:hypothetical protein
MSASFAVQGSTISLTRSSGPSIDLFRVNDSSERARSVCDRLRQLGQLGALGISPEGFLSVAGVPLYATIDGPPPFTPDVALSVRSELFALGPGASITAIEPASKVDIGVYDSPTGHFGLILRADDEVVYKSGGIAPSRSEIIRHARDLRNALLSSSTVPGVSMQSPYNIILRGMPKPFTTVIPFLAFGESLRAAGRIHAAAKALAVLAGASRYRRSVEPEVDL